MKTTAPVRVLDAGGWTDTWFAGTGAVCQLAVSPGPEVRARVAGGPAGGAGISLEVASYGDRYDFPLEHPPGRHPLLEAVVRRWAPPGRSLEIAITSPVPAGSSLGTSAAVAVALVAALRALDGEDMAPEVLAQAAHEVETVDLGRQSGVQDQVAAAFGGANLVRVDPYPRFDVERIGLAPATQEALARRVVTVYLGAVHDSSEVHRAVIARLESEPRTAERLLQPLRQAAAGAAQALRTGDLGAYGTAMTACTRAQAALHPSLVNPSALEVIEVARRQGAAGWKVNGAGGPGGTVSIILADDGAALLAELRRLAGVSVLALSPSALGAHVTDRN